MDTKKECARSGDTSKDCEGIVAVCISRDQDSMPDPQRANLIEQRDRYIAGSNEYIQTNNFPAWRARNAIPPPGNEVAAMANRSADTHSPHSSCGPRTFEAINWFSGRRRSYMRMLRWPLLVIAVTAACACTRPSQSDDWIPRAVAEVKGLQQSWYEQNLARGIRSDWMLEGPNPTATDNAVTAAETRLGVRFDDQFRRWLTRAGDGWPGFAGSIDLYPLNEISRDNPSYLSLVQFLQNEESKTPAFFGVDSFDDLTLFGSTADGVEYVTVACPHKQPCASAPVWVIDRGDYTRFDSLKDFIDNEIRMTKSVVDKKKAEQPK